jgi:CHAT domain-containing protein
MSGTRSVCLSIWKVDDTATALLMQRFYANLLGQRPELNAPLPKAEALREAKAWLRTRTVDPAVAETRSGTKKLSPGAPGPCYEHPYYWAGFILVGDPS